MDYYKDLIEKLQEHSQSWAAYNDHEFSFVLQDAATTIETLLTERDTLQDRFQDLQITLDMYGGIYGINEAFRKAYKP